jgi:hypothetical protein
MTQHSEPVYKNGVDRVVAQCGGVEATAILCGVTASGVLRWIRKGQVPMARARDLKLKRPEVRFEDMAGMSS